MFNEMLSKEKIEPKKMGFDRPSKKFLNFLNKYYGLNSYKLGFGSRIYEYAGDFEFITNKPLYLIYKNSFMFKKEKK